MSSTPRAWTRWAASLAMPSLALAIGASCVATPESDGPAEEVGEARQPAASGCVTIQRGQPAPFDVVEDAHIAYDPNDPLEAKANKNYGAAQALTASTLDPATGNAHRQAFVRWDLSGLPAGSYITSATATFTTVLRDDADVQVSKLVQPGWSEGSVTWNNLISGFPFAIPIGILPQVAVGSPVSIDVTNAARSWYAGPNYGLHMYPATGQPATIQFHSSESLSPALRPALDVCYVPGPCAAQPCQNGGTCSDLSATTYTCACPPGFSGPTCGCGIAYETRPYSGSAPPDTASAIAAFNAAPAGQPGYGSTTLSSLDAVSNQSLFGSIGQIAYHWLVSFDVTAADAGVWDVRLGADYGLGGTLLVDGVEIEFQQTDMWYAGMFSDPNQYLSGSAILPPGPHTIESYGFENCCDGVSRMEYSSPTSGGWQPVTTAALCQ